MRNINPSSMTVEDSLANFGKKLNKVVSKDGIKQDNPVYNVFHSEKSNLRKYFAEYNAKTQPCKLEDIRSHYVDEETRNVLYNMYNRQRSYMQNEWDTIAKKNGELQMCPICGMKPVTDWDHYIPRSVMPEYSMHLQNLIPTCGECNGNKGNDWLEDGRRIYFNAYYDEAPDLNEILNVVVTINNDLPSVSISLKEAKDDTPDHIRIACSTISQLNIINMYWQPKINEVVRAYVSLSISRVNVRRRMNKHICIAEVWNEEKEVLQDVVKNSTNANFIERLVYHNIIVSDLFSKWFLAL